MDKEKVVIFDTTLRDGEQAAGAGLNWDEKLEIARQLESLGVDVIEAGFPASSPGNLRSVQEIAQEVRTPVIAALARCIPDDVDTAWEAVKNASQPRIHVFISSSDIHMQHALRKSADEVLEQAVENVKRAKTYVEDVEFSPMDATRTDPEFLYRLLEAAIDAGATTVNIPDTVGYAIPEEFGEYIQSIKKNVPNIDKAVISVHCHNDLGLASANTLSAIQAGARQAEVCINGIGERAGNASLEEVVMALLTRQDFLNIDINIDATQIYPASRLVSEYTGFPVQPNKAVVGSNAFRHESGIHQAGIINAPITFEIMDPHAVGVPDRILPLGRQSGRHALESRLSELGYEVGDEELGALYTAFKELADKKASITSKDLEALMGDERRGNVQGIYRIDQIQVSAGSPSLPTATVRLIDPEDEIHVDSAIGTGPIDAVYQVISKVVGIPNTLVEYRVEAITEGLDALGEVVLRIEHDGVNFTGRGSDTDIIVASAKAYVHALNRTLTAKEQESFPAVN